VSCETKHTFLKQQSVIYFFNNNNKEFLQPQTFLGLHDFLNNAFCHGFTSGQIIDAFDHLGISFPFVL